jgi:hypothetical protein
METNTSLLLETELSTSNKDRVFASLQYAQDNFTWRQIEKEHNCSLNFGRSRTALIGTLQPHSTPLEEQKASMLFMLLVFANEAVFDQTPMEQRHERLLGFLLKHFNETGCADPEVLAEIRAQVEEFAGEYMTLCGACISISVRFFGKRDVLFRDAREYLDLMGRVAYTMVEQYRKLDPLSLHPVEWEELSERFFSDANARAKKIMDNSVLSLAQGVPAQSWLPSLN